MFATQFGVEFDNSLYEWAGIPYGELSVLLSYLKFMLNVHQTHHWQAKDDPFYGDHKLFQSLYEQVENEIDLVAEKAVGLGSVNNVDLTLQILQVAKITKNYYAQLGSTIPSASDLAYKSLQVEQQFLSLISCVRDSLKATATLTYGVDNMLAGIYDTHESHVYLLKQRCSK